MQKLLEIAAGPRWSWHRPLLVTAAFTGMRASELRGLTWSAVDFDTKTIAVRQRADEWGAIGMPKSAAGQREIPVLPTVLNTLREWKLRCPQGELDLVFLNTVGKIQPLQNLAQRFGRPLQKAAGLIDAAGAPLFNFHSLRHFTASWWIGKGFSPKRLQQMLGHSSIQMTFDPAMVIGWARSRRITSAWLGAKSGSPNPILFAILTTTAPPPARRVGGTFFACGPRSHLVATALFAWTYLIDFLIHLVLPKFTSQNSDTLVIPIS